MPALSPALERMAKSYAEQISRGAKTIDMIPDTVPGIIKTRVAELTTAE